jgi:hypothetical protein
VTPEEALSLSDDDLLERQAALQREADGVAQDLELDARLGGMGDPVRVGSSALGLMVWRDLDVTVACPSLDLPGVAQVGAGLAAHPRVSKVVFLNSTGSWNIRPAAYPDRLYLGLSYRSADGQDWELDIWFVDEPERQSSFLHVRTIPPQLDRATRLVILRIKAAWVFRPEYGRSVRSYDIYKAVLRGGVRDVRGFDDWLASRPVA